MKEPLKVSELVYDIKESLESNYRLILCEGEVSNLSSSGAGHWYFTLSDEHASISCALFKMDALRNPLIRQLKDGDKIIISGPISVYPQRGSFQLLAKKIVKAGVGGLLERYEKLKKKLQAEGLFDLDYKKKIPTLPRKVALITAYKSAAMADFINVMSRRNLWQNITVIPTLMQGKGSAKSVIDSIQKAKELEDVDVIVITRGGGSLEDLWSFNNEELAREIFACPIPIISAIGHQTDYTICDYVADKRVETPTAAAETLSEAQFTLGRRLELSLKSASSSIKSRIQHSQHKVLKNTPRRNLHRLTTKLAQSESRLMRLRKLEYSDQTLPLNHYALRLDDAIGRVRSALHKSCEAREQDLISISKQLNALSPHNVLKRGYSLVRLDNEKIITNLKAFNKIEPQREFEIVFSDGSHKLSKES